VNPPKQKKKPMLAANNLNNSKRDGANEEVYDRKMKYYEPEEARVVVRWEKCK